VESEAAPVRASDAARERVARSLGAHLAAGRLSLDEFSDRVDRAYRAATLDELQALTADLPGDSKALAPPTRSSRRPFWPGNHPFITRIWTPASAKAVKAEARRTVMPLLIADGYELEADSPSQLTYSRRHRPFWTIALAVFAFPIGLLALAYEDRCQVAISLDEGEAETVVTVSGTAPLGIRRAIRSLALEYE
jgi:hypothetical protein